jgi:hypothetical protein
MPISYEVKNSGNFVHSVATGPVSDADLLDYQTTLLADPRVKPGFHELFDATAAHDAGLSEAVLEKMVETDLGHAEKLRGGKCVVVVRDGFKWAERFTQLHKGPNRIMVFVNMEVARAWVGIDETASRASRP